MAEIKNPFFKAEDLQNLEFSIEGRNLTSQVILSKGGILLVEILLDGVTIEVPPRSCSVGHTLALDIEARKLVGTTKFTAPSGEIFDQKEYLEIRNHVTGVVETVGGGAKERQEARLLFRQFSKVEWQALLTYLTGKQSAVNQLIKNARK